MSALQVRRLANTVELKRAQNPKRFCWVNPVAFSCVRVMIWAQQSLVPGSCVCVLVVMVSFLVGATAA